VDPDVVEDDRGVVECESVTEHREIAHDGREDRSEIGERAAVTG
jgi:hypothetical protein